MKKILQSRVAVTAAVLLAVALSSAVVDAQMECGAKLSQCGAYMNATVTNPPPESCCGPMRDAVNNDLGCLCAILDNASLMSALHISSEKAFSMARACGVQNLNGCPPANAPNGTPAPPAPSSAAVKMDWFALSGLMSLFLSWCFIVA